MIAIKTVVSLERYLITNFKNRQFIDLRAHNFADVSVFKNKISKCGLDDDVTAFWGHIRAKFFS